MGYSKDFKMSVIKFHFNGNTIAKTAETFSIAEKSVKLWKRELQISGDLRGRKIQAREHLRRITPEKIDEFLRMNPNGNQLEMAEHFGCKPQSVQTALKKFGYSKKKNKSDTMKPMSQNVRYTWLKSQE